MNANTRFLNVLRGEVVDKVPLMLEGFMYPTLDEVTEPFKREIVERIFDDTFYFYSCHSYVNRYLVTPSQRMEVVSNEREGNSLITTTRIETPKGDLTAITGKNDVSETSWILKYPCENLEDVEKIRSIAWELPESLMPMDLSNVPGDFESRGISHTSISSPFVCVAGMMSYEYFLELCFTELNLIKELTQQCFERIMDILGVILAPRNIEYVWMGGCEWLTPPMASPALYEELVHKFEKPIIERIHEGGALSHVHCHGNVRSTLEMVIERGADFFEPVEPPPDGDITMAEAKTIANGRITLGGNVESRILEGDSVEAVGKAVLAAFEGGKERMVLHNTAGPISQMTPRMLKNYHRLIDIWEELCWI